MNCIIFKCVYYAVSKLKKTSVTHEFQQFKCLIKYEVEEQPIPKFFKVVPKSDTNMQRR